ncbi:hypothetical protein ES702_01519 [subsurface metagenome]
MNIRSKHIGPIILAVFIIGIGGTIGLNLWRTTSAKVPAKFTSGEYEGEYNPADIRGSYTFSEVSELFEIPLEEMGKAFGLDGADNMADFKCGNLKEIYGTVEGTIEGGEIGTDSVKFFVSLYTGLSYTPEETTLIPAPAMSVLKEKLSEEELKVLENRVVTLPGLKPVSAEEPEDDLGEVDTTVKGNTTFQELLDWGLAKEEIETTLGTSMGKPGVKVRDYCVEREIEFSGVKDVLQEILDANNE